MLKFVSHSKKVISIAIEYGWLPAARYSNLRDIKTFDRIGFIDIDWKDYNFTKHLDSIKQTSPLMTVAKDIEKLEDLERTLDQAMELKAYCKYVAIVPKTLKLIEIMETSIPNHFIFGYSVPTKYGKTPIPPEKFKRRVHLLGGRPDIQRKLADKMNVFSIDLNRFTYDARFGDYFDGEIFRPHPKGGYENCIRDSIINTNKLWSMYSFSNNNHD